MLVPSDPSRLTATTFAQLEDVLPRGEYHNVAQLQAGGLVSSLGGVIARATCLREGGVEVIVKAFPAAKPSDDLERQRVFDLERLTKLLHRLREVDRKTPRPPIVPLIEMDFFADHSLLVIVMLRVTPATQMLERPHLGEELGLAALERLWPPPDMPWCHWDISLENVGFIEDKSISDTISPCLLDVESVYLDDDGLSNFPISIHAARHYRLPERLRAECNRAMSDNSPMPTSIARRKQEWETTLVAAELSLATRFDPFIAKDRSTEQWLLQWQLAAERVDTRRARIWYEHLTGFCRHGRPIDMTAICSALRAAKTDFHAGG